MKKMTAIMTLILLLACASAQAAPGWRQAQNDDNTVTGRDLMTDERRVTLDEAVNYVRRTTGGRILSARTLVKHGHAEHRIKVLTPDKQVRIYIVDEEEDL